MNAVIIPARGGSQRIPRKNIREFGGKPMIAWSVEAALATPSVDQVIVSTDDAEIAEIAQQFGANVPFLRNAELADHHTPTVPVIADAIKRMAELGQSFDNVCCLYATAPFVRSQDLENAYQQLVERQLADYIFSVAEYAFPVQRAVTMNADSRVGLLQPDFEQTRSQDLPQAYHDAGQFYWGRVEAWLQAKPIMSSHSYGYKLPRTRVQDIDTEADWEIAEWMFKRLNP
ncbi:pseudaminic acid cytidylyltransferase [Idiomarina tyrosinivorans]|uniref:Pseudaminic acid cytidylyltransferase n=1 Tax=Idiomarina tyrosinivorans TaxID=1445662 RepID=A0A432ZPU5_9GAMM|nr:pseudaminic acid cytidylyltransferase [Idiomarina tyrosinivorans]RUO79872.1 pseudaminic acid cytidylyltransferase [Idiomarina tyrosinivorans]